MPFKLNINHKTEALIDNMVATYKKANLYRYRQPQKYYEILSEYFNTEINRRIKIVKKLDLEVGSKLSDEEKITKIKGLHRGLGRRENIIETMVDWAWTYNPQNLTEGLPAYIPMVPWWRQVELIEWIYEHIYGDGRKGGLVEKSRETAVSWTFMVVWVQEWRWTYGFAGGVGSNKFEAVDKRDDPKCLFEKMRAYLKYMPDWWLPKGWNPSLHDKVGNLVNPENKNTISGDGGQQIGTGGRTVAFLCDEKAKFDFPNKADASLSYNTKAQFDVGTYDGPNEFYQKRMSGQVDVFVMDWHDDPRKSQEWYEREKEVKSDVIIAQELDRNPLASVSGIQIKPEWVEAAFDIKLKPAGPVCTALDVAAGGVNKSALAVRMGPVFRVEEWDMPNGIDLAGKALDHSDKAGAYWFSYDEIGVGHSVKSAVERMDAREIKYPIYGLNAGKRDLSDMYYEEFERKGHEVFADARSEWWYLFAQKLEWTWEHFHGKATHPECNLIDLERNGELKAQLCSPLQMTTTTGQRKTESKKEMLGRGIKSPDMADSLVMANLPRDAGRKHVIQNDIEIQRDHIRIAWDSVPKHNTLHYAAVCQLKDLSVEIVCAIWHEVYGHLYFYDEAVFKMPSPQLIARTLVDKMRLREKQVDRIIGNDRLFADEKRSVAREINNALWDLTHQFESVKIKKPQKYDPYGSVVILNRLINTRKLTLDNSCTLLHKQLASWRLDKGEVRETGMREGVLMIMSKLIQVIPREEILKFKEYYRRR